MNLPLSRRNCLRLAGSFAAWIGLAALGADTRVIDLRIAGRRLEEGPATIRLAKGEKVVLRWTSDERALLHLHGYDLEAALEPGVRTPMAIDAHLIGRFPVTAHGFGPAAGKAAAANHRHEPALLYLEVHPE
jgi:hypothetical protein